MEKLKILSFMEPHVSINCVAYGPFDNGHILLGLSDGWLLAYEYPSLDRLDSKRVYMPHEEEQDGIVMDLESVGSLHSGAAFDDTKIERQSSSGAKSARVGNVTQVDDLSSNSKVLMMEEEEAEDLSRPDFQKQAIMSITIDPANLILTSSRGGQIVALTPFERRHNYYYLELGEDTFCTVGLPSARAKEIGMDGAAMDMDVMARCCI